MVKRNVWATTALPLVAWGFVVTLMAPRAGSGQPAPPPASLSRMTALLEERAAAVDPLKLPFLVNDRRADIFAEELTWPRPMSERLGLRYSYATELVKAGRIPEALAAMDALQEDAMKSSPAGWPQRRNFVLFERAIAYLRMGEEQNCHLVNNRDSCLLPIKGQGVHQNREGCDPRRRRSWAGSSRTSPDNLEARWLLNVAHMTLGSYPDGVPPSAT